MENTQQPIFIENTVDNGIIENVHIAPIGNFTGSDREGNPIEQNIDADSLNTLADKLNQGDEILADIDHGSAKSGVDKNTAAAGWFSKFIVDPIKGLFGMLRLTKTGKELIENREYRYISPAFQLDKNGKPVDMIAASLTNMPAFAGAIDPILNTTPEKKEIDFMEKMTKDDLVALIKETVISLNTCADKNDNESVNTDSEEDKEKKENTEEVVEETKTEEVKETAVVENEEKSDDTAENKEEIKEDKKEEKEDKEEDEEVIKLEALNSMPNNKEIKNPLDNLHGSALWDYINKHPYG